MRTPNFQTVRCANCFSPIEVISPDESESYRCEPSCNDSKPANPRELNAALKAAGITGVVVRQGRGYVYFSGPAVETCFEQSANVFRVSHASFEWWVSLAREKVAECRVDELTTAAQFDNETADRIRRELAGQGVSVSTDCILSALKRGDSESEIKESLNVIWADILTKEAGNHNLRPRTNR